MDDVTNARASCRCSSGASGLGVDDGRSNGACQHVVPGPGEAEWWARSLVVLGLSFRQAPIALRERLVFPKDRLPDALRSLRSTVAEGVILSTCGRVEIYAALDPSGDGPAILRRFLSDQQGVAECEFAPFAYQLRDRDAVLHLMSVAAGLDSLLPGEAEVLDQVGDAFRQAARLRVAGPTLTPLFRRAIAVGRRARASSSIQPRGVSLGALASTIASREVGGLRNATVLVIGTGRMGRLVAQALMQQGVERYLIASHRLARAESLAVDVRGEAVDLADLRSALDQADVVISCTVSTSYVITRDMVRQVRRRPRERPLMFVDLAVPRVVEPSVGTLPGVILRNLDDLPAHGQGQDVEWERRAAQIEGLVAREVEQFCRWWESRDVVPTIRSLVRRAAEIREAEVAQTMRRLGHLDERDRAMIDALGSAIVSKLLHLPITRLKDHGLGEDREAYVRTFRVLFGLDVDVP